MKNQDATIKKVIIPIAGLGTRFLPLSKIIPKEAMPLVDKPVLQKLVEEARGFGAEQIIFVISKDKKPILNYFKNNPELKKLLKQRGKNKELQELNNLENLTKPLSFSFVEQKKPLGDGHAILQVGQKIREETVGVLFGDDIVESETPCLEQLNSVYKTCQRPVIALCKVPKNKLSNYGMVKVEKIARRVYKIKNIIEKPSIEQAPSDLAIVGKYILTSESFDFLKNTKPNPKGEIILANAFKDMLQAGKSIYGYEIDGKWLECGNKLEWLKTNAYLSLKDPRFGPAIKEFLKENKLI
jgi:UTP--glucose-1-phosphate uridylyltransferase